MAGLHTIDHKAPVDSPTPPLLFIHGACLGAWCWEDHFLAYFGQLGYRCVALDLRGHGASAGRDRLQDASIDDFVNDVAVVASRFEAPPVVIGHSMGRLIAQRFAARHPASGLVLLASSPIGGMRKHGWMLIRAHPWPFLRAMLARDMLNIYPDDRCVRQTMFSRTTPENTVSHCRERLQSESWRACMEMNEPISPPLAIGCPILVLGGECDGTVPAEAVIATGKAYQAETRIFPGAGHNLMLEPCWQEVGDCIDRWIRLSLSAAQISSLGPANRTTT